MGPFLILMLERQGLSCVRPVAPEFSEKLADVIKGLLSAKIIQPSTSPWASPNSRDY